MTVSLDSIASGELIGWADARFARLGAGHIGNANRMTHSVNGAASAPAVAITGTIFSGGSATTTKPQLLIEPAGTTSTGWSTAGTLVGVNAASGFTGNLLDLQLNGSARFSINSSGYFTAGGGSLGCRIDNAGQFYMGNGGGWGEWDFAGIKTKGFLGLAPGFGQSYSVFLYADGANTFAQRNGTNPQLFHIYNTYTSGSVYERGFMRWASNVLEIGAEHSGGSARAISFKVNGTERLGINSSGIVQNPTGFDGLGYVRSSQVILNTSSNVRMTANAGDGVMLLTNGGITGFNRICLGGTSATEPALKRSTTILQARLADDSDFATFQGKLQTAANAVAETPTATITASTSFETEAEGELSFSASDVSGTITVEY